MIDFAEKLFPIHRCLTGQGVRDTLSQIKEKVPNLEIHSIASGTEVFDWHIPKEWKIENAYLVAPDGNVIVDYKRDGNLSVLQYSEPVSTEIDLEDLRQHLYVCENYSDARPYVTSYYKRNWGFCLPSSTKLIPGRYTVKIDSRLFNGALNYATADFPGKSEETVLFSTNICHPSLAINELSGMVVNTYLAQHVSTLDRYYSYKFLFVPETIGTLAFLYQAGVENLQKRVIAGFAMYCVSDTPSYASNQRYWDACGINAMQLMMPHSDDRQYASPNVNLPVVGISSAVPWGYAEYHTSRDNMDLLDEAGLRRSLEFFKGLVQTVEYKNRWPKLTTIGEPFLSKYGLYHDISVANSPDFIRHILTIMPYCDGYTDPAKISFETKIPMHNVLGVIEQLYFAGLVIYESW